MSQQELASLEGVWYRLLEEAPPLGRGGAQDRSTIVLWTQSRHSGVYVDLRLPLFHPGRPDTAGAVSPTRPTKVARRDEETQEDATAIILRRPSALVANGYSAHAKNVILSSQKEEETKDYYQALLTTQSFAGILTVQLGDATPQQVAQKQDPVLQQLSTTPPIKGGGILRLPPSLFTCHWHRHIDCQTPATRQDIGVCAPQLPPAPNGAILLRETGDDASYAEDWLLLERNSGNEKSPVMAAVIETENGFKHRKGYWVWTDNRFAYAVGYPETAQACRVLGAPVEAARIHCAKPGGTLEEVLPQLVDKKLTEAEKKEIILDILGSYVAVAGSVSTRTDGVTRDWVIDYSTHAELLGCTFLKEFHANKEISPSSAACSWMTSWALDDQDCFTQYVPSSAGEVVQRVWKMKEYENLPDPPRKVFGMDAHPDYVNVDIPRSVNLPSFQLTPLSPDHVDEDYQAVVASTSVLKGMLGNDWPEGLTPQDNLVDLSWHEREFTQNRSFSWIVREYKTKAYLGCAYVFPNQGCRGKAKVVTWIRAERKDRVQLHDDLNQQLKEWLNTILADLNILLEW